MVSEEILDVYCCARGVFCCCCFLQQRGAVCGVRHNFQNSMQNKITIWCQSEHAKSRRIQNTPTSKSFFFYLWKLLMYGLRAGSARKLICLTYPVSSPQRIGAPPRRDGGCQNTCLDVALAYVCGVLCLASNVDWRSRIEELLR